jgi:processive 1,2-diacylglycerol beta-glucosyltransferase
VDPRRRSIAILTADVGEGHLAAARVLAEDLQRVAPEVEVVLVDALEALGPVLRLLLLDAYRFQLRYIPRVFQALLWLFLHLRPLRALGRASLVTLGGRGLRARLEALAPDVVVSTYPAATSVLGTLRRQGRVTVPALATITDFAGVQFWSHPGIDLHLVMHSSLLRLVEREAGPGSACAVAPLAARTFREAARRRHEERQSLGLSSSDRLVVVSGGGWGVGDLAGAVAEAAALPATTVIAVTGRNSALEAKLKAAYRDADRVRVLGFTDEMPRLLAAADVLVHSTGGVTCLEALTAGCPLVAYGAPAGHAPLLARAMAEQKVALHATNRAELRRALRSPLPTPAIEDAESAAERVLRAQRRLQPWTAAEDRPRLRGVLHAVAFGFSCLIGAFVVAYSPSRHELGAAVFAVSASIMLGTSALYHRIRWVPHRRLWMRRADHAGLFLLIAGTYTPVALIGLHGAWRTGVLAVVWGGAALATITKMYWVRSPKWVSAVIGIALGWVAVVALPQFAHNEGLAPVFLLAAGGLAYTTGAVVYASRRPDPLPHLFGYHELFHALTIVALTLQYVAIAVFVVGAT